MAAVPQKGTTGLPIMALLAWPLVVALLFARLDAQRALIWSILAAYLLLPPVVAIDLPVFPALDKMMIPALAAAAMVYFTGRDLGERPPPMGAFVMLLLMVNLVSPMATALTNPDPLVDGVTYRPGMNFAEGFSNVMLQYMQLLPFLLGYRVLWNARGADLWCKALVLGVLWYTIPMLIELRMSPQMNVWVYGFFQHDFIQTIRYGGYRPIVFLQHPLWVAVMVMTALLAAIAIARNNRTRRNILIALYLGAIMVLCKSAGALLQTMMAAPLVLLARPRQMVLGAAVVASIAFAYPTLRTTSWMPLQGIVDLAMSISPERGRSLEFRMMNEERLVERAMERPAFGWGNWGRSLFYDPYDGRMSAVPDGQWVIWIGARGVFGYLGYFLLLLAPIFTLLRAMPRGSKSAHSPELVMLGTMSLMLAMNLLDLIPNATLTPLTWLTAGALLGNANRLRQNVSDTGISAESDDILPKKAGIPTVL